MTNDTEVTRAEHVDALWALLDRLAQ